MIQLRYAFLKEKSPRLISAKIYLRLTFQIGISSRRRGTLERSIDSVFADNIFRLYSYVYFPPPILLDFSLCRTGNAERKATISRYISYCLRSLYRITMYPLSSR